MALSMRARLTVAAGLVVLVVLWALGVFAPNFGVGLESRSMSHADVNLPGVLDPGERIRVARVDHERDLVTYVEGRETGYSFAGDWGDVIAFDAKSQGADYGVGVVHRAIAWVVYDGGSDAYDIPSLGLDDVREAVIEVGSWDPVSGTYVHAPLFVALDPAWAGRHDGWLTKGDNNPTFDQHYWLELVEVRYTNGRVVDWLDGEESVRTGLIVFGTLGVLGLGLAFVGRSGLRRLLARTRRGAPCAACGRVMKEGLAFCDRCGAPR